jgi:CRP-like cAMP-binding protein
MRYADCRLLVSTLMSVHINFLLRFPLLGALPAETLETLSRQMTLRSLARREIVMQKNLPDQGLGFLLDGRLQGVDFTLDGREVGLYFVNTGDYFGELAVADGQGLPEFVIALAKSDILVLPQESARHLLFSVPSIAEQVVIRLASRVRTGTAQRNLLSLPNPMQRLCAQLQLMGDDAQNVIAHAPTHQELAIMINTSRETVTRAFQLLQTQAILRRDGDSIVLAQPAVLRQIAEGTLELGKG